MIADEHFSGEPSDRYRAPALDKGLDILEVLASQARGLTRAEIVKELGLNASQIYRMLERLVARGYVFRDEGGDRYALTMKLFQLGSMHPPLRRLVAQAQPMMDAFSKSTGQSCHLVMPERNRATVVAQASPPDGHWEFRARIGTSIDLLTTGSGLTLLAFQSPARREATLAAYDGADMATQLAPYLAHLEQVHKSGARIEPSEQLVGVTDISVPILDHAGEAVAVLTCAFIEHPHEDSASRKTQVLCTLKDVAGQIIG